MADETFVLDVQSNLNELNAIANALGLHATAVRGFTETLKQYNAQGQLSSRIYKILTNDLKVLKAVVDETTGEITSSLQDRGNEEKRMAREAAAIKRAAAKEEQENIRTAMRLLRQQNEEKLRAEKEAEAAIRNAQAIKAKSMITNNLGSRISGLDTGAYNQALGALNSSVSGVRAGNLDPQRLIAIFAAVKNNSPFQALTKEEERAEIALRRLIVTIERFENRGNKAGEGFLLNMSQIVRVLQIQVLHRIFSEIIGGMEEGIKKAAEFQIEISRIRTITQENQISTAKWSESLIGLSNNFNIDLLDATRGAYDLISNQIAKGTEATNVLGHAFKFAQITGSSAKEAVDLLSFSLNAYKLTTADSERIMGLWFKTIDLGNVTAQQLAANIGGILPFAKQLGISIEEVGVGIETLTIQGVQADNAMTLLKNIFKEFVKPTKEMSQLFTEWGVSSGQAAFQSFGFLGVLQRLDKELQSGGPERLGQLTDDLRALTGTLALSGEANLGVFEKGLKAVQGSTDKFRNAYDIIRESPANQLTKEFNMLKNSFVESGDEFVKMIATLNAATTTEKGIIGGTATVVTGIKDFAASAAASLKFLLDAMSRPENIRNAGVKKPTTNSGLTPVNSTSYFENLFDAFSDKSILDVAKMSREANEIKEKEAARSKMLDAAKNYSESPEVKKLVKEVELTNEKLKLNAKLRSEESSSRSAAFTKLVDQEFSEKGLGKAKEALEKLVKKSEELRDKIRQAFDQRTFENSLDGLKLFETIDPIVGRVATLQQEAKDFFNLDNIEGARNKFEEIQKLVEKTNDELRKQINKSIDAIKDNAEDKADRDFERSIRGKSGKKLIGLYLDRAKELRDQAFIQAETDPDQARKTLDKAIKTVDKANDTDEKRQKQLKLKGKKKLPGDALEDEFAADRDRLNEEIKKRAESKLISEEEVKKQRLQLEQDEEAKAEDRFKKASDLFELENKSVEAARQKTIELAKQREEYERMINAYNAALTDLNAPGSVTRGGVPVPIAGGLPAFASGGLLHGPMGLDNLLIRAHAGEFVVNSAATKAFYPQLVAMNAGMEPRAFANGGPVTNVGDINITQHSSGNVQTDVRELGRLLQREFKRGTVRFQ